MEEKRNTPFAFLPHQRLTKKYEAVRGISDRKIQALWAEGHLTEEEMQLMQYLYHLTFLTGKQVDDCFWLPGADEKYKRLPKSNGKSAYLKPLRSLEQYGIIQTLYRSDGTGERIGPQIYSLSPGAFIWCKNYLKMPFQCEKNAALSGLHLTVLSPGAELQDAKILEILSLNQHLIRTTADHGMALLSHYRVCFSRDESANVAITPDGSWVLTFAIKGTANKARLTEIRHHISDWLTGSNAEKGKGLVLFLTDSIDDAAAIWEKIPASHQGQVLFATDYSVFAEGPYRFLMRFRTRTRYDKLSLDF